MTQGRVGSGLVVCVLALCAAMTATTGYAAVGRTAGSFSVGDDGAASYTIPIFSTPGPNGLQPSLAFVYNSNSGVSYLGKGWSLQGTGISSISRCVRTVAQDGAAASIQLAPSDGYCLDGNRLRLQSGLYGQAGSVYATEIADFSRITAYGTAGGGPAYWVVERKDGTTYTYGNTADSAVLATGTSTVSQWMVNEIRDRNNNKILFTWKIADATTTGVTHPVKIQWTQTAHNSGTYVYSMDFNYSVAGQPAGYFGYLMGTQVLETDLLTSITVSTSAVVHRHYVLTHGTSPTSSAKRLTQVQECADSGTSDCFAPTVITYQDGATGVNAGAPALSISGNVTAAEGRYDFNGDGIKDIAYKLAGTWRVRLGSYSSGYGLEIPTGLTGNLRAGKLMSASADALLADSGGNWYAYVLSGSSFVPISTGITTATAADLIVADEDGDGRDDLVYEAGVNDVPFWANPNVQLPELHMAVLRNTTVGGTLSFSAAVNSQLNLWPFFVSGMPSFPPGLGGVAQVVSSTLTSAGDLDGDRRAEISVQLSYQWCYYFVGGPPLGCASTVQVPMLLTFAQDLSFSASFLEVTGLFRDLNGDGCQDVQTSSGITLSNCTTYSLGTTLGNWSMGDWSGDGRADSLGYSGGPNLTVYPFLGNGLGAAQDSGIPVGGGCGVIVTDGNGDGLDDIGCLNSGSSLTIYYHNGANTAQDLAVNFEDGFGVTHSPTYGSIANGVYTPYATATYPNRDYTAARAVVGSVSESDGIGGTFSTSYTYFGAVENLQGRGFQGFDKIVAVDSRGSTDQKIFRRDWPYSGALSSEDWSGFRGEGNRVIIRQADVLAATPYNERYFVYAQTDSQSDTPLGTTKSTQFYYSPADEIYGNPTTVTTTTGPTVNPSLNWTTTTAFGYSPTPLNWCINLPISKTVTYQAPSLSNIVQSTTFTNHPDCYVTRESVGSSNLQVDTDYGYDAFGNADSVSVTGRNPNGSSMAARTTTTSFGTTGQFPVFTNNALGLSQITYRTFDPTSGSLLTETDPNGIATVSNNYDSFGRLQRSTRADSTSTVYTYALCATYACINGDASTGGGLDNTILIEQEFDSSNLLVRDTWTHRDIFDRDLHSDSRLLSGGYNRVSRVYDVFGRVLKETPPCDNASCTQYWITNYYDGYGRFVGQTRPRSDSDPTLVSNGFIYSGLNRVAFDAQAKMSGQVMDPQGHLRASTDPDGYGQIFSYDAAGSLTSVIDTSANVLFTASYSYGIKPFQYATSDIDLGSWTYDYNSLGELVSWHDANGHDFNQTYDALSRVTSRQDVYENETSTWTWGTGAIPGSYDIGRLASVSRPATLSNYSESYTYDSAGRPRTQSITADGNTYPIDYAYNNQGSLDTLTYPTSTASTRVTVKYGYAYGILQSVTDWTSGSASPVWTANAQNLRGQTTQETLGNGVVTNRDFDAVTGWLNSTQAGVGGGMSLQNQSYGYDRVGNVTQRQENTLGLTENIGYDNLYRMTSSQVNANPAVTYGYDARGNITQRSDVNGNAAWTYDATKKHAVTSTGSGGASYSYDANGNMTTRDGAAITWASYNYPTTLTTGTENTTLYYGPDRQYYRQDYSGPSVSEQTYYIGGLLEKVSSGGTTDWRHNVIVNGQTVAIISRTSGGLNTTSYTLEDNQGSGSTLTNGGGTLLARESFSAFGLPRDGNDWDGAVSSGDQAAMDAISRRGYTGHSMLGRMGLIHMNGRVQDAITGRFLSPDPNISDPDFTQSYNRYAYVNNNPLSYVDPSGFVCASIQELFAGKCNPLPVLPTALVVACPSWTIPVGDDCEDLSMLFGPSFSVPDAPLQQSDRGGRGSAGTGANGSVQLPQGKSFVYMQLEAAGLYTFNNDFKSNDCGGGGKAVPNAYGDVDFNQACKTHDECYGRVSALSRHQCDSNFRRDIIDIFAERHGPGDRMRYDGWRVANTYYLAVRLSGAEFYEGPIPDSPVNWAAAANPY